MGALRSLFGALQEDIWGQIAKDIGGELVRGYLSTDVLRYRSGEWEILLDTHMVWTGQMPKTVTRMRAPFVNRDGLYFKIYRKGVFSFMGELLGMQDITLGDRFFDRQFVVIEPC